MPVSYWINGTLLGILSAIAIRVISSGQTDELVVGSPRLYASSIITLHIALVALTLWQMVGIWRSANNYIAQGKLKVWGNLAQIAVVLGSLNALSMITTQLWPQTVEYAQIAVGTDRLGAYQIRVLRDSTELEVSGALTFGVSADVRKYLNAHPTVRVIHLNSHGGRVAEARALRDLIATRGLITYTSSHCASACTLAYMAGKERWIAADASLGFHQYSLPGTDGATFVGDYRRDSADWTSRGISADFAKKAFLTPSSELWKPAHKELFAAGVITKRPNQAEVGFSGMPLTEMANIEKTIGEIPLYAAIREHEPKTYSLIVAIFRDGMPRGRSIDEMRGEIMPLIQPIYLARLGRSSDESVNAFATLVAEQMRALHKIDPIFCYDYIYATATPEIVAALPKELAVRELDVMAAVIRTGGRVRPAPSDAVLEATRQKIFTALRTIHGDKVDLLAEPTMLAKNKELGCRLTHDMYVVTLKLPPAESGDFLRWMFAQ